MMPDNHRKEALSKAYIRAIAAKAGYPVWGGRDYGDDLLIKGMTVRQTDPTNNRHGRNGFDISVAAKASVRVINRDEDDHIKYDLEKKTYNDLVDTEVGTPLILVLLDLPRDETEWCESQDDGLLIKRKAYWYFIQGEDALDNENGTKRIQIPKDQEFNVESLKMLMDRRKRGGNLNEE